MRADWRITLIFFVEKNAFFGENFEFSGLFMIRLGEFWSCIDGT